MTKAQDEADDLAVFLAEIEGEVSKGVARQTLATMRSLGRKLHAIYERQCNGHQDARGNWDERAAKADEALEAKHEARLRALFAAYGLGLYLNTDPRGNAVAILTPKSGRYNTMGGREAGWRL